MKFSNHPVWLVGFRPFFLLAMLSGIVFPIAWALIFNNEIQIPTYRFSILQWHAHEMFFGFGFAVLGGFLLTATKNWVKIRGFHGCALIFLSVAWLIERLGMYLGGSWSTSLFLVSNNLFLAALVSMLMWTLIANRKSDFYKDNIFFLLVLPLFLVSKFLILTDEGFRTGISMANGLFRMAFLIMLERTLTQFMKSAFQVELMRNPFFDNIIKACALLLVFEQLIPSELSLALIATLAVLLGIRFYFWHPRLAFQRIDIGIMYLGFLAIVLQLIVEILARTTSIPLIGSVSMHIFTFGAMGLNIPAMIIRIANGHTGRKVHFGAFDKMALWMMLLGFIFRVLLPQAFPAFYKEWIYAAAICWMICFLILALRYSLALLRPRVDGKEH